MQEREEEYFTREEAARMLGISARTVDRYAREGKLKQYRRLSKLYFKTTDVLALGSFEPVSTIQP